PRRGGLRQLGGQHLEGELARHLAGGLLAQAIGDGEHDPVCMWPAADRILVDLAAPAPPDRLKNSVSGLRWTDHVVKSNGRAVESSDRADARGASTTSSRCLVRDRETPRKRAPDGWTGNRAPGQSAAPWTTSLSHRRTCWRPPSDAGRCGQPS